MFDLTGYKALITGASGGIGGAIAEVLHAQGATVVLTGTKLESLENKAALFGDRVMVKPFNLEKTSLIPEFIDGVESECGGIDILIANAGITRDNLILRMKEEDWQAVINVNLTATFMLNKACFKHMMKRRYGRIINITSVVGITGNAGQANYAASKAGVTGMTKSVALESASRNITVNCIAPGFITTQMTDILNETQKAKSLEAIPLGCFGKPEDVAYAAAFLASKEAGYITGQTIHVNGGMAMI